MRNPTPLELLSFISYASTRPLREKPVTRWLKHGGRYPYSQGKSKR